MTAGKKKIGTEKNHKIVRAITQVESTTTSEIHVHLCRRWLDKDAFTSARQIFDRFGLHQTTERNAILIYVNLRKRKLAILGDTAANQVLGQSYWNTLAHSLGEDLKQAEYQEAIVRVILKLGEDLRKHFPLSDPSAKINQLRNEVTET